MILCERDSLCDIIMGEHTFKQFSPIPVGFAEGQDAAVAVEAADLLHFCAALNPLLHRHAIHHPAQLRPLWRIIREQAEHRGRALRDLQRGWREQRDGGLHLGTTWRTYQSTVHTLIRCTEFPHQLKALTLFPSCCTLSQRNDF